MSGLHYLDPAPSNDPAVILLHGLGTDSSSWVMQMEPLSGAGFRPIAPDAPGFGGSASPGRRWSIRGAAAAVAGLAADLGVTAAHIVGISMGGVIAQQVALDYPKMVRRLVLVNTFARLRPQGLREWMYWGQRAVLAHTLGVGTQAKLVARNLFPDPTQEGIRKELVRHIRAADPRAYRAALRALGMHNGTRRLHEIRVPTLVVSGDRDMTVPVRDQRALAEGISGSKHITLTGGGHALTIDRADEFNQLLLDFLCSSLAGTEAADTILPPGA